MTSSTSSSPSFSRSLMKFPPSIQSFSSFLNITNNNGPLYTTESYPSCFHISVTTSSSIFYFANSAHHHTLFPSNTQGRKCNKVNSGNRCIGLNTIFEDPKEGSMTEDY